MPVTVRYFAAARDAAGAETELADAKTFGELITILSGSRNSRLRDVLAISTFLIDGLPISDPDVYLSDGMTVEVLPPFAGG